MIRMYFVIKQEKDENLMKTKIFFSG